jgi:hypothetical protein
VKLPAHQGATYVVLKEADIGEHIRDTVCVQLANHPGLFLLAATLGLGVHFLTFLVVQSTNSVTLKVRLRRLAVEVRGWRGGSLTIDRFL